MFFKTFGYIHDIINNCIILNVSDEDEKIKLNKMLKKVDNTSSFFKIQLNIHTTIQVKNNYKFISELKGCFVYISGYTKYYCFATEVDSVDELTNTFIVQKKYNKGYKLIANKVFN
jgi:hypothetical protein